MNRHISRLLIAVMAIAVICAALEIATLEDEIARLQMALQIEESLSYGYREQVSHLRSEIAALNVAVEEARVEIEALQEDNAALVARLKELRASTTGWSSAKVSWYGPGFYGRRTASGAVLTQGMMNVAHKSLPFGTRIQFEYKGRTAIAVVNDRGPFVAGRLFDLGPGTAAALGFSGVDVVRYRVVNQ